MNSYRLDPLSLGLQFGLVDRRLSLNTSRLGPRLSFSLGGAGTLHRSTETHTHTVQQLQCFCPDRQVRCGQVTVRLPERLQLQQLLPGFLGLGLVGDPLPLQLPPGLLLQTLRLVSADGEETFLIYDE